MMDYTDKESVKQFLKENDIRDPVQLNMLFRQITGVLLEEMRRVLDEQESKGVDNWYHWSCQSQYYLLAGDEGGALDNLQRAVDSGLVAVFLFDAMFRDLEDNDRYRSIAAGISGSPPASTNGSIACL